MTIETVTEQTDEPGTDPYGHYGTETIPAAQLRLGDVIDYPHGPAAIVGLASPDYLTYALGPGSVAIRHASRAPRAIAGHELVRVLLPRPCEVA
ncbi:hypothetical protein [Actinomadura madurae]|uniref:hypothetical protein n=1 Tax=Actinomadura madurae TaxID=1993 RepID=UPI0020D23F3E|nr:hypothetical protein [Actinomadura madurae]MCP9947176.1 hypothetical protein [Actinomadura madurae]MCP9963942.1 hypothetical protein [Actinomadura madurae]MCP9976417.1 hypothetical protein [Actinomadura madurae]MCQ0012091.1 hypothetical protein [Actinomadura madurae]MCQ0012609.1 hypothetical protein [Actinomadura madurae]